MTKLVSPGKMENFNFDYINNKSNLEMKITRMKQDDGSMQTLITGSIKM